MSKIFSALRPITDLWSLVVGLKITGRFVTKKTVTVHYPRKTVETAALESFSGPIQLIAMEKDPTKSKCIACMMCVNACPSACITIVKAKAPVLTEEQEKALEEAEARGEDVKRPTAPREPVIWINDFSLCSLCSICIEVCPTQCIEFSHDVYLAGFDRDVAMRDLLIPFPGHTAGPKSAG